LTSRSPINCRQPTHPQADLIVPLTVSSRAKEGVSSRLQGIAASTRWLASVSFFQFGTSWGRWLAPAGGQVLVIYDFGRLAEAIVETEMNRAGWAQANPGACAMDHGRPGGECEARGAAPGHPQAKRFKKGPWPCGMAGIRMPDNQAHCSSVRHAVAVSAGKSRSARLDWLTCLC